MICPKCYFKCSKSQLYKTGGFCPRLTFKNQNHEVLISISVNKDVGAPTKRPAITE